MRVNPLQSCVQYLHIKVVHDLMSPATVKARARAPAVIKSTMLLAHAMSVTNAAARQYEKDSREDQHRASSNKN